MADPGGYAVSLIVPIHDVEDYLGECLASIQAQTIFDRTEVVLLDDGSTDGSGVIAAEFAAAHLNVLLISQANQGLGAARNAALAHATAPLVTFLDSDDVLPVRSLELRVDAMDDGADVVVGGLEAFPTERRWEWQARFRPGEVVVLDTLREHPDLLYNASVANKVFRRAEVERLGLRFAEGRHFEDAWFSIPAMLAARRVALVGDVTYLYRQHGASIMGSIFTRAENYEDQLVLVEHLLARVADAAPDERALLQTWAVHSTSGFLRRAHDVLDAERFADFFARSRALFADVPVEVLLPAAVNLPGRLPFVGLLEDRPELLDLGAALSSPLAPHGDALVLDVGARPEHLPLLAVRRPKARATSLELRDGGELVLEVVVRIAIPNDVPIGADLSLRADGPSTVVSVPLVPVGVVGTRERTMRATLVTDGLDDGRHRLRLVLATPTGSLDVGVRATPDVDLGRGRLADGRHLRGDVGPKGGLALVVEDGGGSSARVVRGLKRRLSRLRPMDEKRP